MTGVGFWILGGLLGWFAAGLPKNLYFKYKIKAVLDMLRHGRFSL
jgi:hypothetical protein